ncbi:MAG TPA: hypothetical protein PLP02_00505 [Bacillota bacterium]|nr:hypothetical protein [Bacillota bacterium]HRX91181.1 hypothetical protein [Candidatus Izemoplasmatales bacterium]
MKKILSALLVFVMVGVLSACTQKELVTVMVPSGSPALAQLYIQEDTETYQVDVVQGADPLIAAFTAGTHDFIFAPTNLGAKLYTASPDYVYIAAVVFGNYYLVADMGDSEDTFDLSYLDGREMTAFGANSTGDIVMKYIFDSADITPNIIYVDSVATATSLLISGETDIILTAEPSLSVLLAQNPNYAVIDLQTEYENLTGESSYPQAGVFAKATLTNRVINNFLKDLEDSIDQVNESPSAAATLATTLGYTFGESVLQTAIPNSHLGFVGALDSRSDLEAYFTVIMSVSAPLIGGALPVDDFYYQP